jgi:OOP family OmpA-OmpF porin
VGYLTSKGVAANRLTAKGYGKASPVADNKTEEGRARNRRVEIVVR